MENMVRIVSDDGRFEIVYRKDCTGWAQVMEFNGFAPRLQTSQTTVPFSLLATLMDNMLFNTAAVEEPSKEEFNATIPSMN